jgi:hypothetical protein
LRFQADFHLSAAASAATRSLSHNTATPSDDAPDPTPLYRLLRLAHLRQRFSPPQHSELSTQNSSPPPLRRIGEPLRTTDPNFIPKLTPRQLQLIARQHNLCDPVRIPDEQFFHIAWQRGCAPPLHKVPFFPDPSIPPATPAERFYRDLLMDASALLWYLQLYGQHTGDHRHSPILANCKHLIPAEPSSGGAFPRFVSNQNP